MGYRNKRSRTNHIVNLRIELSWNVFVEEPANTGSRTNYIVNVNYIVNYIVTYYADQAI